MTRCIRADKSFHNWPQFKYKGVVVPLQPRSECSLCGVLLNIPLFPKFASAATLKLSVSMSPLRLDNRSSFAGPPAISPLSSSSLEEEEDEEGSVQPRCLGTKWPLCVCDVLDLELKSVKQTTSDRKGQPSGREGVC